MENVMTDEKERIKTIVKDAISNKPLNIGSNVKDILQTRVADAIDRKRPEVYGSILPDQKDETTQGEE